MTLLAGRHALITGIGIGAAIARTLACAGAAVSLAGRRGGLLAEVTGARRAWPHRHPHRQCRRQSITGQAISVSGGET